jgi:eukaryotic-like serine/threonine-protein kinase
VLEHEARSIFMRTLGCEPDRWDEVVREACASNTDLQARVDELLRAHRELGLIAVGHTPAPTPPSGAPRLEGPGAMIGPYRILEEIGEGGFGVVYMSEQVLPVRRKVALKILKPGMDTKQVVARFEAERQALALMDHPNIARVLDGGATPTGRPYFVMELVRGASITDFCDQNRLPLEARVDLLITVCKAVQHAHQKGIIHRDLKPSNVMVSVHDDKHVVKVIDFGIAKAVGQQLTEKTLFTNFAQLIGTPPYMSPEQAQLSGLDVDTRSDIYALGVLLYELLTGTTPFDQARLRTAAFDEIRRIIREEAPPRPSTRLNSADTSTVTASGKRGSDPRRLSQLVRGELDWIVMKCLEKDRNRRYETANGLAMDLVRYLNREAVQACPPSLAYRLHVFTRRHRASLGTAALLLAVTSIGGALTAWQAFQAEGERHAALRTRLELSATRQRAAEERANAMARDLATLNRANSLIESGRSHADFAEWAKAEDDLDSAAALRPDHSSVWLARGDLYGRLGLWDLAAEEFRRASPLLEPGSVRSLYLDALLRKFVGDEAGYLAVCHAMVERFDDPKDPNAWEKEELARACLLAEAPAVSSDRLVALTQRAVDARRWPTRLASLGTALYRAGQYELALDRLRDAKAADPGGDAVWPDAVAAMAHHRLGRAEPARDALRSAAEALARRSEPRPDGPAVTPIVQWWNNATGQLFYREAKKLIDGVEPADGPRPWCRRGDALVALGRHHEAIANFGRAIELDPGSHEALSRRSRAYLHLRDWPNMLKDQERLLALRPQDAELVNDLAWALCTCPDVRYRDYRRAVELARRTVAQVPLVGAAWNTLAIALYRAGDCDGAVEAILKSMRFTLVDDAGDLYVLAMCQWRLGHRNRARQLLGYALCWGSPHPSRNEYLDVFRAEAETLIGASTAAAAARAYDDPSAYTLLLEIEPGAGWIYALRGVACARVKQWDQSAADLARAADSAPLDPHNWYGMAVARLGAGDLTGYRQVRSEIIRRFSDTKTAWIASHLCYIGVVEPADSDEAATLFRMAEFAVSAAPGNPRIRGAIHYRAGRYAAALDDLARSAAVFPRRAWDWLFLAMAHQQLGHADEARKNLKQAQEWIDQVERTRATGTADPWFNWCEPVEVEHLLREAKALIH